MGRYTGWIIAGVVCLIIITLSVTGILTFGNTPTTGGTTSSVARVAEQAVEAVHTIPLPFLK